MASPSNIYTVAPTAEHTHTIIFLHGRGSNATEFGSEFFESQARDDRFFTQIFPGVKWVFPCAWMRHAEIEDEDMCQWFDMACVQRPDERPELQKHGMKESVKFIVQVVQREAIEVGSTTNIILAGISQGCATAIMALLCGGLCVAGFIGLSSWLPFSTDIKRIIDNIPQYGRQRAIRDLLFPTSGVPISLPSQRIPGAALCTPVLLEHSEDDDVVPIANGICLYNGLQALGMSVERKKYATGGHWVNEPQGVDDMVEFIKRVM